MALPPVKAVRLLRVVVVATAPLARELCELVVPLVEVIRLVSTTWLRLPTASTV